MKNKLPFLLLLMGLLYGCGFHFRGQDPSLKIAELNDSQVYLSSSNDGDLLYKQLRRDLQFSKAIVQNDPANANWHIVFISTNTEKKSSGIDSNGRTNEYELTTHIEFIIESTKNIVEENNQLTSHSNRSLSVKRIFYFDNNDPIGKRNEEKTLREAMRKQLSGQIIKVLLSKMAGT